MTASGSVSTGGSTSSPSTQSAFTGIKYGDGTGNTVTHFKDNKNPICEYGQKRRKDGSCYTPAYNKTSKGGKGGKI